MSDIDVDSFFDIEDREIEMDMSTFALPSN